MERLRERFDEVLRGGVRTEIIDMTCDLVDIPSPTGDEATIADLAGRRFTELGMEVEFQEIEPGRHNVVARLKGSGRGRSLLFGAHFDTGMTGADPSLPFGLQPKARIEDGWIYGLGVSNMKSAFAAYYGAIRLLAETGTTLAGDLLVNGVVGETEKAPTDDFRGAAYRAGGWGTMYAAHHGVLADAAIVGEPTGLRVQTGNTSYAFARVTTFGTARHTWSKEHGDDAIEKAVTVLDAFRRWEPEFEASHSHPRMGARIGFGAIRGGNAFQPAVNPARSCTVYLDLRFPPNVTIMDVRRQVRGFLDTLEDGDPRLTTRLDFYLCRNGYEISDEEPIVRTIHAAHHTVVDETPARPEPYRYAVSADTSILHDYGVPALTYGPGGIRKDGVYDVYDEYGELVSIDNLIACTKVYALSAVDFCGTT